jgi:mono/diheme cytochrome c family protein
MRLPTATIGVLLLLGCPGSIVTDAGMTLDAGALDAGVDAGLTAEPTCLPPLVIDADQADAGRQFLFAGQVGGSLVPRLAFDNLWRVWANVPPADVPLAIRERYGFSAPLTANDGLPMGFRADGQQVRVDCLVCHAGEVAGQTVVGAGNNRVDLELFIDDLKTLARSFGFTPPNPPALRTGARGVNDIIGMTMQLAIRQQPPPGPINTEVGFQDAPAWWTLADKTRIYADGSGPQTAHRTMMATQLAFGATQADLERLEPQYIALREYLLTLKAPVWPFAAPAGDAVARGRALFRERCTSCHRDDRCERAESTLVPRAAVGTDAERSVKYGPNEVALIAASWFGQGQKYRSTGSYSAPSLRGVWASAPYLHNGSVPTLEAVLDSSKRPRFFRVLGTRRSDYDELAVGLKVEVLSAAPTAPPRAERSAVYDTTKVGLGNQGHLFGDALTPLERQDLLAFLKTQ